MTVSSELSRKTYAGNGSTTSFDTSPMTFLDSTDLTVYVVTDSNGASTTLVENTNYTVSGTIIDLTGGSAPHGAPAAGVTLVISREVAITQGADLVNNDSSDAEVQETALDRLTMIAQQNATLAGRALRLSDNDTADGADFVLPASQDREGLYLAFDSNGLPTVSSGTGTDAGLRADLAASSGSSLVGFTQAVTGATGSVAARLQQTINADDAPYNGDIFAAVAALNATNGGTIELSNNKVYTFAATQTLPTLNYGVTIRGKGEFSSILSYTPTTGDFFNINGDLNYWRFENVLFSAPNVTSGRLFDFTGGTKAAAVNITAISQASPCVVTAPGHGLSNGDVIYVSGVGGMTQLNGNYYVVANVSGDTFRLAFTNATQVSSAAFTAFTSGGTIEELTGYYDIRDFSVDNFYAAGFEGGIRIGAAQNTTIGTGRLTRGTQGAGVGIQIGDSGQPATTTRIKTYVFNYDDGCIWNNNCPGLFLDGAIIQTTTNGLRADRFTTGFLHMEGTTNGVIGTGPVSLTALQNPTSWGTIGSVSPSGVVSGAFTSAGQQATKIRWLGQSVTKVSLHANVAETADSTFRTLKFDTADYNINGEYATATGLFTAQIPGMYRISAQMVMATIALADTEGLTLVVTPLGGAAVSISTTNRVAEVSQTNPTFILQTSSNTYLGIGDTVEARHAGSTTKNIYGEATGTFTYMTIELMN